MSDKNLSRSISRRQFVAVAGAAGATRLTAALRALVPAVTRA